MSLLFVLYFSLVYLSLFLCFVRVSLVRPRSKNHSLIYFNVSQAFDDKLVIIDAPIRLIYPIDVHIH
ncbi:hypothetical protein I7I50_04795 [Histoplasma capsulatum G186AR]|uniref:Uncharacterized protein n=1 Tax=Ajellomyces capsulatus TaxID=5037 RepID=A0A8H8CY85_AJECA|nr:hypothetical protein I7I52_05704 [Histoplasma capsulatum]QSS75608.1 hypothetical protein I7I50_04795 [Histoplasma capsulatum G186AR]